MSDCPYNLSPDRCYSQYARMPDGMGCISCKRFYDITHKLPDHVERVHYNNDQGFCFDYLLKTKRAVIWGKPLYFNVNFYNFEKLRDGEGEGNIIAWSRFNESWYEIRVYKYYVITYFKVTDKEKIEEIENSMKDD